MSDTAPQGPSAGSTASTVVTDLPIHFVKSTSFRVIHANGAWFGSDVEGNIHMTFFNERTPIPQMVMLKVDAKGLVIAEDETKRVAKAGWIREMEADIIFSRAAAIQFYHVLGQNMGLAKKD
jgi:hypothetical protein